LEEDSQFLEASHAFEAELVIQLLKRLLGLLFHHNLTINISRVFLEVGLALIDSSGASRSLIRLSEGIV
jgi:hypothetical protein